MRESDSPPERTPSRDDVRITRDGTADGQPQELPYPNSQQSLNKMQDLEGPWRPAFLSCKWPEGSEWCVELTSELQALGMPAVHDARHRAKVPDVEGMIRGSSCVVMLVTPGFYHGLANKPVGNRALKEVKMALQYGKPLLAVIHASYCGQNPLPLLISARELTSGSEDGEEEPAWSSEELSKVARTLPVFAFKGGDGFDGYQRELVRQMFSLATAARTTEGGESEPDIENAVSIAACSHHESVAGSLVSGGGDGAGTGGSSIGGGSSSKGRSVAESELEAEEKRLRDVLRAAGLARRVPSLLEGHIRSLRVLEKALRRGRLSGKPFNWHDSWVQRVTQVLEAWPVICTMPDWLRAAPEGLVPLLVPLLAQEEPREFDRDGRPRPRRGALPPITSLDLSGQGPVVVGPRGAAAVAGMIRDVSAAQSAASRRQQQYQQQQPPPRRRPPLYGTATTMMTLTHVNLNDCGLGTSGAVDVLAAVVACPSILTLLLGGNGIDDDVAKEFEPIVRRASASSGSHGGEAAKSCMGLRNLGLDRNALTDAGAAAVVTILYDFNAGVTTLDLSGNVGLGTATVEALVRSLRGSGSQRLTHVGLMGTQLDEAALVALLPVLLSQQDARGAGGDGGGGGDGNVAGSTSGTAGGDLDLTGNTVDSEVLAALATAAREPGYSGGPRAINLTGSNLRLSPPTRRQTFSAESAGQYYSGSGRGGSGNVSSLAAALQHSYNLEELRLGWCGMNGAGLRTLVWAFSKPQHPLPNLTVLDLTGNKLGSDGVALLGALLPVNLPSLRHLVLDECGFGGRELGILAGMLDVAPWVVHTLQGVLNRILNENITGTARGSWMQQLDNSTWGDRPRPWASLGDAAATTACTALEGLLRAWLEMDAATAAAELKRIMLPPGAAAAAAAAFASPHSIAARRAALLVGDGGPSRLAGLGCLLVHPVVQPVLEALRQLWDAAQAENEVAAAATAVAVGVMAAAAEGRSKSPLHSAEARTAFRALDSAFIHLRNCAQVQGLASLSMGRNSLAQEAGAPLGAAVSLSSSVRHLGLHGIVQPPPPAVVAGTGAAAAAAAAAAAQGGPLAAAAAAARDARTLLRLLYSPALAPALPNPFAAFRQGQQVSAVSLAQASSGTPTRKLAAIESMREVNIDSIPPPSQSMVTESRVTSEISAVVQSVLPGLRSLDLTDAGISSHNAGHLAEFVRHLPSLEQIVLDFNSLSCPAGSNGAGTGDGSGINGGSNGGSSASSPLEGAAALFADLAALPCLSYVSLNYACDAGAMFAVADHLLGLALMPPTSSASMSALPSGQPASLNLRVLSLVGCPLDVVVARRISRALLYNTSLAVLRLGGGDPPEGVGPIGSRVLTEALTSHRGLVELSLSGVGLTDNAARMLADALPQLTHLCKLDLSDNSFTGYGVGALAGALLARNRNAVGTAAHNRLSMQVYGNRVSEELETRIQSLSVSPSMTYAADRMPNVRWYGAPPPSRGDMGGGGGGLGLASSSPYAPSYYRGNVPGSRGGGGSGGGGLPAPPSLVPSPALVRAPVTRPSPVQPLLQSKAPRCASSPPRASTAPAVPPPAQHPSLAAAAAAAAAAPTDPSRPLGSGKPTLLTAIPPPPPARRGSLLSEEAAPSANGMADSIDFSIRLMQTSTSKLTRIYGGNSSPPLSPTGAGYFENGRRSSPAQRPLSSPTPALKALPMALSQMRAIIPGAPYAAALVTSGNNPLLNGNRNRPTAGSCSASASGGNEPYLVGGGIGGGIGGGVWGSLPSVRKSYPATEGSTQGGTNEVESGNGNGNGNSNDERNGGENGSSGKAGRPKGQGASDHLMLRTKCHTPDWVNRMQEDFYKKVTAPLRPATSQGPPPPLPGPPSEHLFRKLLCHDSEWQRSKQMEQFVRETTPEAKPQPVPGAPAPAQMVSTVALIQRGSGSGVPRGSNHHAAAMTRQANRHMPELEPDPKPQPAAPEPEPEPEAEPTPKVESQHKQGSELEPQTQCPPAEAEAKSQGASASAGDDEAGHEEIWAPAAAEAAAAPDVGNVEAHEERAVCEDVGESPAPLPSPSGGLSLRLAGLSGRLTGTSGNLGSEESMEVLAVRNTGRKAAIEVMRIRKAKDTIEGASPDLDEEEEDDAHAEQDHGDAYDGGTGDGLSCGGPEDRRDTDPEGSNPDGKNQDYVDGGRTDGTPGAAGAAGPGSDSEGDQRAAVAAAGAGASGPQGGEGDGDSKAAPSRGSSRRSSRSRNNSNTASADMGEVRVRDGATEEASAAAACEVEASTAAKAAEEEEERSQKGDEDSGDFAGYYAGTGALSPVVSAP